MNKEALIKYLEDLLDRINTEVPQMITTNSSNTESAYAQGYNKAKEIALQTIKNRIADAKEGDFLV